MYLHLNLQNVGFNARITGLRLRGPNSDLHLRTETHDSRGIEISGRVLEEDNNDTWNWPRSG